jgi:hypothetical protein
MKSERLTLGLAVLFLIIVSTAGTALASPSGFAAYSVQVNSRGSSRNLTVNESISPTSNAGFDRLILKVASGSWNFNYSRSVNSSLDLFPFVPAISNQSFSYSSGSSRVSADVTQNGTLSVSFQGKTYQLTSLSFRASFSTSNHTGSLAGVLYAFPSGLVYSLRTSFNATTSFSATLQSTSLPLNAAASSSSAAQIASAGLGAGAVLSVVGLSLGVRSRRRKGQPAGAKPDYWVD